MQLCCFVFELRSIRSQTSQIDTLASIFAVECRVKKLGLHKINQNTCIISFSILYKNQSEEKTKWEKTTDDGKSKRQQSRDEEVRGTRGGAKQSEQFGANGDRYRRRRRP
jgi:hypothetical protein